MINTNTYSAIFSVGIKRSSLSTDELSSVTANIKDCLSFIPKYVEMCFNILGSFLDINNNFDSCLIIIGCKSSTIVPILCNV